MRQSKKHLNGICPANEHGEGYEIEHGMKKAQLGAAKTTAEMKADLYSPGVEYLATTAQIEATFTQDERKAIKRVRNKDATNRSS